jgi:hypothetical protein
MSEVQRSVILNGTNLPIKGAVSWQRITPFPQQFMTTAPGENDYTPTRKQKWGKLQGGLGIQKWSLENNDRIWDASAGTALSVQTLPPLVTTMGTFGKIPVKIIKHEGTIYAIGHNQISAWSGTAWVSKKTDFPNPTDAITFYGVTA